MTREYERLLNKEEALDAGRQLDCFYSEIWPAMNRLEFDKAAEILSEARERLARFRSEPARLQCEIGIICTTATLAESLAEFGDSDRAYTLALSAWASLLESKIRWRSIGMPSEGAVACADTIGALAAIAWLDQAYEPRVPSVEKLLELFFDAAQRLCALRGKPSRSGICAAREHLWGCSVTGTELAKVLYRARSGRLAELIEFLDEVLALELSPRCMDFAERTQSHPELPFYWDFEIAKMIVDRRGTLEDYDHCHRRRADLNLAVAAESMGSRIAWDRQRRSFMRGLELAPVREGRLD